MRAPFLAIIAFIASLSETFMLRVSAHKRNPVKPALLGIRLFSWRISSIHSSKALNPL
jgi:hypothetical protein